MSRAASALLSRLSFVLILLAIMFGTTVAANADTITQNLTGPGGVSQLLTVNFSWSGSYSMWLGSAKGSSADGSDSGSWSWGQMGPWSFVGTGAASGYNELVTLTWNNESAAWNNNNDDHHGGPIFSLSFSSAAAAVPEESSLIEIACVLAMFLGIQVWAKRRSRVGSSLVA
jgi:hypothetical protein